ncbi:unnamed protein product [Closterium sp. NIES-64]|nr:unnamed protein product [Closterium sp. NIES-64]
MWLALDVPGAKRLVPKEWRERWGQFRDIYDLVGVPVITVQLRYDGWVTEMNDIELSRQLARAAGLDNLLYSPDADFSCFADLALTSPNDYYKEGQSSLMQSVPLPPYPSPAHSCRTHPRHSCLLVALATMGHSFRHCPFSPPPPLTCRPWGLTLLWHSVVKINQSLYREAPGLDQFRPDQKTPDYLDSMEGVTVSGRRAVARICEAGEAITALAS